MQQEKKNNLSPEEEESLRFVSRFYDEGKADTSTAWRRIARQIRRPIPLRVWVYRAVAAAAILVGVIFVTRHYRMADEPQWVVLTAEVENRMVTLPDASELTLAPHSSLRYDRLAFNKAERVVALQGKAYFSVQHRETCPFRVVTPLAEVCVLGTRFQVVAAPDSTAAWVESGKVRFSADQQYADLTPGMRAVRYEGGDLHTRQDESLNTLAWKTRKLVYRSTPLVQVVGELQQLYKVHIDGLSDGCTLRLTATFEDMNISDIIRIINRTLDTRLTIRQS